MFQRDALCAVFAFTSSLSFPFAFSFPFAVAFAFFLRAMPSSSSCCSESSSAQSGHVSAAGRDGDGEGAPNSRMLQCLQRAAVDESLDQLERETERVRMRLRGGLRDRDVHELQREWELERDRDASLVWLCCRDHVRREHVRRHVAVAAPLAL